MSETTTSQNPFEKMFADNAARVEQGASEYAKLEKLALGQMAHAIEESAKLTKSSLEYAAELATEWRRLQFESLKAMTTAFTKGPLG